MSTTNCCPNGYEYTGRYASAGIGTDVQRLEYEAAMTGNHTHYQPETDNVVEVAPY